MNQDYNIKSSHDDSVNVLVSGDYRYDIDPLTDGADGIIVTKSHVNDDREPEVYELPPVSGRYYGPEGVIYLVPREDGAITHQGFKEIDTGTAWLAIGKPLLRDTMRDKVLKGIWYTVADRHRVLNISPKITEGLPPTAPEDLKPAMRTNEDEAREAFALLGRRLGPLGRWAVGLGILSPWLSAVGGEASIVHFSGAGGAGKSQLARFIAALFGSAQPEDDGLFMTFNSTSQGVPAHATSLSYYPVILDEANTSTSSPEPLLTSLVMGSDRKRASRTGASVKSKGRWTGIVFTTGNNPLDLKHEMFDRRSICVQANDIWGNVPEDILEQREFWVQNVEAIRAVQGWAWEVLKRESLPGSENALVACDWINKFAPTAQGNIGTIGQIGLGGAAWLAHWTDEDSWNTDVEDSIRELTFERVAERKSPAEETAINFLESIAFEPYSWEESTTPGFEPKGFQDESVSAGVRCELEHPEDCRWYSFTSDTLFNFATVEVKRLLANDQFKSVLFAPSKGRLTRRIRMNGTRGLVYTACVHGLEALAGYVDEDVTEMLKEEDTVAKRRIAPLARIENTEAAVSRGYTDLVTANAHSALDFKEAGWSTRATENAVSFRVKKGDLEARIWIAPSEDDDLKDATRAIYKLLTLRPDFTSPTHLAHQLIMESEGSNPSRHQMNEADAERWKPEDILHAQSWGLPARERRERKDEFDQYDRNKAHLSSIAQCNVAPLFKGEDFEEYGSDAPIDNKHAGFYLVTIPEWDSPLPNPMGNAAVPGDTKWVSNELMQFMSKSGIELEVHEAHLAPVHRVLALQEAREKYEELLEELAGTPAAAYVKSSYQAFAGTIGSYDFSRGKGKKVYRQDWAQAIRDASWCNVLRVAKKVYDADNRFVPVAVNVDAIYYPKGLGTPPEMKIGDGISQFKHVEV